MVLPAICEQVGVPFEVILAGQYRGRHSSASWLRVVTTPVGTELFYKPFQIGVNRVRFPYVVDMDDDMVLAPGWWDALRAAPAPTRNGLPIWGFTMLNPDGGLYGGCFDVVDNRLSGPMRGARTYFSAYLTPIALFHRIPYPTYHSGDRVHTLRIARARLFVQKQLLEDACVVHAGENMWHPGMTPKTNRDQLLQYNKLRAHCEAAGVAWEAFADRYLDGRPHVCFSDADELVERAAVEPDLRATVDWLQAAPAVLHDPPLQWPKVATLHDPPLLWPKLAASRPGARASVGSLERDREL
jgi:hypothetical protein